MAASKIILQLTCLLLWEEVHFAQLSVLEQQKGFKMVDVGDTVTLQCFYEEDDEMLFITWYKQRLGDKPALLASRMKLRDNATISDRFKNDPRFSVVPGKGLNHLMISDVQLSDSAMYYCGMAQYYKIQFNKGIMVIVKGSSSSIQAIVQQPPKKSVQPGDSVTLNCTVHTESCGEHSVYWFRRSEKSQPVFFYTHEQRCEIPNTTQGSFYNFSMKNLKLSDAGTYYCALASCGEILYGNGTRLNVEGTADTEEGFLVYFLSVALVISIILVIVLSSIIYKLKWKTCSGHSLGSSVSPANTAQNEGNLHYAALSLSKKSRSRTQRNVMENDTVYTGVR